MTAFESGSTGRERSPEAERKAFLETTTKALAEARIREWKMNPQGERDTMLRTRAERMLQSLAAFHTQTIPVVDAAFKTLRPQFDKINEDASLKLEQLCDRLKGVPPTKPGDEPTDENPYLVYSTVAPLQSDPDDPTPVDKLPLYQVNNAKVKADIAFLESVRGPYPPGSPESNAIDSLIIQLQTYRLLDIRNALTDKMHQISGGRTMMDVAGKKMGRVALTGVMVAITAIFGAIGLVNFIRKGEISLAPFLWAFATWFIADPGLINSLFDSNAPIRRDFDEVRRATSDPALKTLAKDYHIGGPAWAKTIDSIYAKDYGGVTLTDHPTPEAVTNAVNAVSHKDKVVEAELRTMFSTYRSGSSKNDFQVLVDSLSTAKSEGTQDFVRTYVANNCFREGLALDPVAGRAIAAAVRAKGEAKPT